MVEITSEAATAWAKTMMKSWKSYSEAERQEVIALSLAKAIGKVAEGNSEVLNEAAKVLRG